jgi:hypothetical protein
MDEFWPPAPGVSNLVEGSDKAWGIYMFYTDSEVEPKPWAGCLYEGQSAASPRTVAGTVQSVSLSAKVVFLSEPTMDIETIAITEQTQLADSQGNRITLREIQPGQSIQATGKLHENSLLAIQITVTSQMPSNDVVVEIQSAAEE